MRECVEADASAALRRRESWTPRLSSWRLPSVRHEDTEYDNLLMAGVLRREARQRVSSEVDQVLERWRNQ